MNLKHLYCKIVVRLIFAILLSLEKQNNCININFSELKNRVAYIAFSSINGIRPPKKKGDKKP